MVLSQTRGIFLLVAQTAVSGTLLQKKKTQFLRRLEILLCSGELACSASGAIQMWNLNSILPKRAG